VTREQFHGVWVAMVTPWDEKMGKLKSRAIPGLVGRFSQAGVRGLFILGTTGEGTLIAPEARMALAEEVLEASSGSLPVVVHTGHDRPDVVKALSRHAHQAGAAGVAVAPPCRYRLILDELKAHYLEAVEASRGLPFFLYDIPGTTGNPLGAELLHWLHDKAPEVIGAKVSRTDWEAWEDYLELVDELLILVGTDELAVPLLALGAGGLVSSCANILPELYVKLFRAAQANEVALAAALQRLVIRLCRLTRRGRVGFVKEALNALGQDVGKPVSPLLPLSLEERREFIPALQILLSEARSLVEERG